MGVRWTPVAQGLASRNRWHLWFLPLSLYQLKGYCHNLVVCSSIWGECSSIWDHLPGWGDTQIVPIRSAKEGGSIGRVEL